MQRERPVQSRRIYLFGGLRVQNAGALCNLSAQRSRALLAYLVLHPAIAHRREMLAELLAPDAPWSRGRRVLSHTLYRLQKSLGADWLLIAGDTVALKVDAELWVDVWDFDRLTASELPVELQQAVELYAGDLMPEIYDDWILPERELRRNQYLATLDKLATRQEAAGELQEALLNTRRLILSEPLHEPAHQAYLRLLGRLQRYGEALAHYDYLCRMLQDELHAEPLAGTRAVVQAIERERDIASALIADEERMPFVGRRAERAAILAAVEAARGGHGSILALEGEAGIGKSRLLREIAAGACWRGMTLLQGTASEVPEASPFAPLTAALAPLFGGPRAAQLETLLPGETLAALAPLHPGWRDRARLLDVPAEHARNRFFEALRPFAATLAQLTPLLLALDDLQWADPALWQSLSAIAAPFTQHGGLLILVYRRSEIEQTAGWGLLQSWDRAGLLQTISLGPLGTDEVRQLVRDRPSADPGALQALTGGNPFLISEWLAEPALEQSGRHYTAVRRLGALSEPARAALELAAVLGESVRYRLWAEIAELPPLELAAASEELALRYWLQSSAFGYVFAHDLLRSAVYEQIEPQRRRLIHESAARAYQELEPDNVRVQAFHLDRAGLAVEAARTYRRSAEQELARFAFREAESAFERALALLPPPPTAERVEMALALARVYETTGQRARQRPVLEEALSAARKLGDDVLVLQVLLVMGNAANQTSQLADAHTHLTSALALARRLEDRGAETYATFLLGDLAIQGGKWHEAYELNLRALDLARTNSDAQLEGRTLRGLGLTSRFLGALEQSVHWLEQALEVHRRAGDRWSETITMTVLLGSFYELGAWDRLTATADEALRMAEAAGMFGRAAEIRQVQGLALYAIGDYPAARGLLLQAEEAFETEGHRRMAGLMRNILGLIAQDMGDNAEAERLYRVALADAQAVQAETEGAYAAHDLGALLFNLGQPAAAIPLLEAADAQWREQGNTLLRVKSEAYLGLALFAVGERERAAELAAGGWATLQEGVPLGEQPQGWLWALHRLLMALGRPEAASTALRVAYDELQRQARAIGDPELRRGFFERVPLNRAIVAAHDRQAHQRRVMVVKLARREAPLGRALRAEELVDVQWSVSAPEDELLADKAEQRRQRLKRLLREAETQGAAPTDDDLARALGVSRRTILRDMQTISQQQENPSTRKRKI